MVVTRREFLGMARELEQVQADLKCLRWQVSHLGEAAQPLAEEEEEEGHTWTELQAMVQCERDPCQAALSSDSCLQQQPPLTRQDSQAHCKSHGIDPELYAVSCGILQSVFPGLSREKEAAGAVAGAGRGDSWAQAGSMLQMFHELLCGAGPGQQEEGSPLAEEGLAASPL